MKGSPKKSGKKSSGKGKKKSSAKTREACFRKNGQKKGQFVKKTVKVEMNCKRIAKRGSAKK